MDELLAASAQDVRLSRRPSTGLRAPGTLGRRPTLIVLLAVTGLAVFGVIAIQLHTNGALIQLDAVLSESLHAVALHRAPVVQGVMIAGLALGVAWSALVYGSVEWLALRRQAR